MDSNQCARFCILFVRGIIENKNEYSNFLLQFDYILSLKNYDLVQDQFFIYNEVIDIPLKANTYIIFEYIFESEYINIPLVINLKIDDILEKDFNIHLKKHNEV